ncbi:hypothetical protein GTP23_05495 [Pseudoduganella sp. FT93W]|uniref:Uncharacterized protein n=1 Tax=Duganella fentianensis TaxID=2692177 RepID=A0A845HU47_9BURK|nr:hypothetical protein [Duganella fentianensis]MYN44529.1 hypothetical protein [Duganella fentianensis]
MSPASNIEAVASQLSDCAAALHRRILLAMRPPAAPQAEIQALFGREVALRMCANGLYLDAARLAASGLDPAQQQVLAVTARARATLEHIQHIKDVFDFSAELLALGAAIASGKPEHVLKPLENIKHQLDALDHGAP